MEYTNGWILHGYMCDGHSMYVSQLVSSTILCTLVYKFVFFRITNLFSSGGESFLAISAAEHAGGSPVHHGASVGPDRAP